MPIMSGNLIPYLVLFGVPLLLMLFAQWRVKSTFAAASRVAASSGLSGAEVAREIMRAHNITNVGVEPSHGVLSDHYDPKAKMLRLSQGVFDGHSVAALGIAAHEAGHAIQDASGYAPLKLRSAIVPFGLVAGYISQFTLMGGVLAMALLGRHLGIPLLLVGVAGLCVIALLQLITLPVEFDASRRAKQLLTSTGLVAPGPESSAMSSVLNAAALTYIAALVSTVGTILYYLLLIMGNSRRD